jgi:hypothetical protein
MEIVTITCKEDIQLCVYQLKSMHKYLEPCTINVVINEVEIKSLKQLIEQQRRKMYKHRIKIWSRSQVLKTKLNFKDGWIIQQLLKLFMPLKDDYIVLDCKDIFLKETKVKDILKLQYKEQPHVYKCPTWGPFFNEVHTKLHRTYLKSDRSVSYAINGIQTPRIIKKIVIKEILSNWKTKKEFLKWWSNLDCMPSEFVLYDYVAFCIGKKIHNNQRFKDEEVVGIWNMNMYDTNQEIDLNKVKKETRVLKLHKRVFNNSEASSFLKKWLDKRLK